MANLGKKRLNRLIDKLKELRRISTMETANFDIFNPQTTIFIKETTRLYRESWLIEPLDRLIEEFEKLAEVSND